MSMTHRKAVLLMIGVTLMWSMAGVGSRHLEAARGFEMTFWRSGFNALALLLLLGTLRGPAALARSLLDGGRTLWVSGLCWAVMFTTFMMALALTTVANVLVTMAIAPLLTALVARFALGHRLAARTWGPPLRSACRWPRR
jgi:drug/metabolite transporter (DMT)-like permease